MRAGAPEVSSVYPDSEVDRLDGSFSPGIREIIRAAQVGVYYRPIECRLLRVYRFGDTVKWTRPSISWRRAVFDSNCIIQVRLNDCIGRYWACGETPCSARQGGAAVC